MYNMVLLPLIHKPWDVPTVAETVINIKNIHVAKRAGAKYLPGLGTWRGIKQDCGNVLQGRVNRIRILECMEWGVRTF